MTVVAYQSFNANTALTHNLGSIAMQRFTVDANHAVRSLNHHSLVLPYLEGDLASPVQGPAELKPVSALTGPQTVRAFGAQISLVWQNLYRALGDMPAIMVVGEFDSDNGDFASIRATAGASFRASPAHYACQSFSAITNNALAAQLGYITAGEGFVAYSVDGLNVVFVHVPNDRATDKAAMIDYYVDVANALVSERKIIDIVIGDTNQPTAKFTAEALNKAFGTSVYLSASGASATRFDTLIPRGGDQFDLASGGTNAKGTKMYDIAVYRSDMVDNVNIAYLSQSAAAVTVTDHCGLGLSFSRR